jgi:hypothetical protein
MLFCSSVASAVLCPIMGVAIFSNTLGSTSVGPGIKSFLYMVPPEEIYDDKNGQFDRVSF